MKLNDATPKEPSAGTGKAAYETPRLVVFGSVGALTKGQNGSVYDKGPGTYTKNSGSS